LILLGSTGSIGQNALEIARRFDLNIDILVAGNSIELLNKQIEEFSPRAVVIGSKEDVHKVNHPSVSYGEEGILEAIESSPSLFVINALVGFLGLRPTLKAIEWYLLNDSRPVEKMIITASGGAFRDWDLERLHKATLKDALKHPNWSMGQKITIDSASMVNKTFELLEARWLFGEGQYDAVIETQSIIHALIDFKDGSSTAHFANADMRLPIAYALLGKVEEQILKPVNLVEVGSLEFRAITAERYPIWEIKDDLLKYPKKGAVLNAANEAAIELFIEGKIGFLDISKKIIKAYENFTAQVESIEEVFALDTEVRAYVRQHG
jgi:1-deoxy-D-xylulose-5-phosphate reductoisomerase